MKTHIVIILFTCISILVRSQTIELDESISYGRSRGSHMRSNPFHIFKFKLSNEYDWQDVGLIGAYLRPYLADCAPALAELDKFKIKRIVATTAGVTVAAVFLVAAVSAFGTSDKISITSNTNNNTNTNSNQSSVSDLAPLVVPVVTLVLIDVILAATSNANLRKCVVLYNSQYSSKLNRLKPKLLFGNSKGLGLRLVLQF